MNRILILIAMVAGLGVSAEPIVSTLFSDGSTNSWTQADLVQALQLMNRKYHREIATHSGRMAWHGKIIRQEVMTNALLKVDTYEDGFVWTNKWTAPAPATPRSQAQIAEARRKAREAAAAKLAAQTNGVPPAVAEARQANAQPESTTNITVTVNGE